MDIRKMLRSNKYLNNEKNSFLKNQIKKCLNNL